MTTSITHPTIAVLATKSLPYYGATIPRIAAYAARHDLGLYVERRNLAEPFNVHPSWAKLLLCRDVPGDGPVILWDADLVPMAHAPNIVNHIKAGDANAGNMLAIVWYGKFRRAFRRRYKRWREMGWNCGLVYVPPRLRLPLAGLFGYFDHWFWEQGAINDFALRTGERVTPLDPRWSKWTGRPTVEDCRDNYCLHFAHGGKRENNIGRMQSILREIENPPKVVFVPVKPKKRPVSQERRSVIAERRAAFRRARIKG